MKKICLLIVALVLLAVPAFAFDQDQSFVIITCNSVTSTGACTAYDMGFLTSKITCYLVVGGTAPTSVTVSLLGSIDNSVFGYLAINGTSTTATYTIADATTNTFGAVNQPTRFIKGYYVSKVGGDGTTSVKMVCQGGGN